MTQQGPGRAALSEENDDSKYLLFLLGGEYYGAPILSLREVVQPQPCKAIPNTIKYFRGLINIRGQILGLVDLRMRFGYPTSTSVKQAYLIVETEVGPIATLVDRVDSVIRIEKSDIHPTPTVPSPVPTDYLMGIASIDGKFISLIDLRKSLADINCVEIQHDKLKVG